jgi:ABC-type transporter Mla subunit MlaD
LESLILSIRIERRWPLLCLLVVALAWLAAAGFEAALRMPPQPSPQDFIGFVLAILPPIALALLALALLPGSGQTLALAEIEPRLADARQLVGDLQSRIESIDTALASSSDRTHALADYASTTLPGVSDSAAALEAAAARIIASGEATQRIADSFGEALPALARTIGQVDQTLRAVGGDSAVQLRAVEAMLAAVQIRNREAAIEADAAIANMSGLLARIDEASTRNTSALSKRAYALDAAVDGVLERTTAAVDHMREAVEAQMRGLETGVDEAGKQLSIMGDDGARLFKQRVELLLRTSAQLKQELSDHEIGSERLQALVAAQLDDLQTRLATLTGSSAETVDGLGAKLGAVHAQIAGLAAPLAASQDAVQGLDDQSEQLQRTVAEVEERLSERLSGTRQSMVGLETEAQRLFDAVTGLGASVSEGSALIGDAASALASERGEIVRLSAQLEGHFDAARGALNAIETNAAAAAAEVASGLGAEVARIAAATGDAAHEMRSALAKVVSDAMAALDEAAGSRAASAFGAPLLAEIASIEAVSARAAAASQSAADRLAGQMFKLVETVGIVESRVGEVETRFAVRERNSLAARSVRIIEQLNGATVDVARLLTVSVGDSEWDAYLKGDHSVFARAVVPHLDRETARRMARLFKHDPEFRAEATHFCQLFEGLVQRLLGDNDGEALAATMLSSDIGKIYVAIADAIERLPPTRSRA